MNSRSLRKLQIVVLAAGFSSRLGQPKALARVRGEGLLARTLRLASGLEADSIIVVGPPNASRFKIVTRRANASWVPNPQRSRGLSSSVRRGMRAARYFSAILFLPVDLAHLERRDLERLIRRWRAAPRRLVARNIAGFGGIPLVLPRWLYPKALGMFGDIGLREVSAQLPREQRVFIEMSSAAVDVDTPQALAEARRRFRPRDFDRP
jgi:molybdenum cofactor cytidylyltransferase